MSCETLPSGAGKTVCVTGAGGFIASWIVKLLLEKGYVVRGTVRNPEDSKNDHLRALEGAAERLTLYRADLLNYNALRSAVDGCDGIFHTASPMINDLEQMLGPAVKGARILIDAAAEANITRVVFTSSIGAVYMDPNRGEETVVDESCWSDLEYCKSSKNWYCFGKVVAERTAWETAEQRGVDLVVINPVVVLGPQLQPTINVSTNHILKYLTGSAKTFINATQVYVDVRDVARAHLKVYETPSANGRYICANSALHRGEICRILGKLFPEYPVPTKCSDQKNPWKKPYKFTANKMTDLGINFIPLQQTLYDAVKNFEEQGFLNNSFSYPIARL